MADAFAVVTMGEAAELREAGISQPILVLQGPQTAADWPLIDSARYWLKVDSGMGRLGLLPEQAAQPLCEHADLLQQQPAAGGALLRGVLTHFSCADEPSDNHTAQQIARFQALPLTADLELSLANSAAILAWPTARADWARPGLMLYGASPFADALPAAAGLQPVMRVTAPLIAIRRLPAGSGIGYGQAYTTSKEMTVGWVAAGYADGVPRTLNETATVSIRGQVCQVLGRVSMDSIAVDLRAVPGAALGERVELWGPNHSIAILSSAAGTINYELFTRIRGTRQYVSRW